MNPCPTCKNTPLDAEGRCVTCAAAADGLILVDRNAYPVVRQAMDRLEEAGLAPEVEQIPNTPDRAEKKAPPLWNLYVPEAEVPRARELLMGTWGALLEEQEGAREAAARGQGSIDLDAGGEITCPACGHTFPAKGNETECPDCGLGLGVGEVPEGEGDR